SDGWRSLDRVRVEAAVSRFRGAYEQRPPAYSAVKVEGERAYRRARRGEAVTLPARRVEVGEFALTSFAPPDLGFRATVSAGTYLRGLARDLGEELGCGAHLATLVRTRVGPFRLDDAVAPEAVTPADLRDPAVLVAELPRRELDQAGRAAVIHARPVSARLGLRGSGVGAGIPGGAAAAHAPRGAARAARGARTRSDRAVALHPGAGAARPGRVRAPRAARAIRHAGARPGV